MHATKTADPVLENWRLIGEVRATRGDPGGAQAAFDKAKEFER